MKDEAHLTEREELGFDYEMSNLECLKGYGYSKFITYHNPTVAYQWLRRKGFGVDLVLKLGEHTYYVEEKFMSYDYKLSQTAFYNDTLKRFENLPEDANHTHLVVVNRPQNYSTVSGFFSGYIVTFDYLLNLIRHYLVDRYTTNLESTQIEKIAIHDINELSLEVCLKIEREFNGLKYEDLFRG